MNIQNLKFKIQNSKFGWLVLLLIAYCLQLTANAQTFQRDFKLKAGGEVEIINLYGRVKVEANEGNDDQVRFKTQSKQVLTDRDFEVKVSDGRIKISFTPADEKARADLIVSVPERIRLKIETEEGEVAINGNLEAAEVLTDTGTISTNIPLMDLKYEFWWTQSRPRFVSDVEIEKVRERIGGKFSIIGKYVDQEALAKRAEDEKEKAEKEQIDENPDPKASDNPKSKIQNPKSVAVSLKFSTARGIVLLNVSPSEVSSDLRERPLTEAAKAVIRSGDSLLMDAIRRTSPKYFGDYLKTLPPRRTSPNLNDRPRDVKVSDAKIKQVVARVMDNDNRAIGGLESKDFVLTEKGVEREILSVKPVTAPFNLVLMLDVSGSIENYVNFIRKAARNFLGTMSPEDRIAIVIFNEDVKQIATFTTDRGRLSESLDSFDAGGATAYYDAIAYSLAETLKPFKGERTAVVILSDGDDNRSFLPFESLLGSIQESGALIYPLYVPSALVAAAANRNLAESADPLRTRYMGLTSKAEGEGARLAKVSGGVYYPIRQLNDLQKAYEDIVVQLRTAYTITYRSETTDTKDSASPRLRVKVNREGVFVNLGTVTPVLDNQISFLLRR